MITLITTQQYHTQQTNTSGRKIFDLTAAAHVLIVWNILRIIARRLVVQSPPPPPVLVPERVGFRCAWRATKRSRGYLPRNARSRTTSEGEKQNDRIVGVKKQNNFP